MSWLPPAPPLLPCSACCSLRVVTVSKRTGRKAYDDLYEAFDSPVMRQVRREAYGEDVGQHSWVTAVELDAYIPLLRLSQASRLLDVGCGPAGPITYVVAQAGCHAVGIDVSDEAIQAGRARVAAMGLARLIKLLQADSNEPMTFADGSFTVVLSLDVVLHLRDRTALFGEVARVLTPGGKFWFTDAGVVTGPVSAAEIDSRSIHGYTQFAPPGINERELERAGLKVTKVEDRTDGLLENAAGRLAARLAHRAEVLAVEGEDRFERQRRYLETVVALAQRGAMSRVAYVAESGLGP